MPAPPPSPARAAAPALAAALALAALGAACDDRLAGSLPRASLGVGQAVLAPAVPPPQGGAEGCSLGTEPFLLPLRSTVAPGELLRVLVVSERPLDGARLLDGTGRALRFVPVQGAGPPYARLYTGRASGQAARTELRLLPADERQPQGAPCVAIRVDAAAAARPRPTPASGIWAIERSWDEGWERAFSAWVAWLFRPIPGQRMGWRPLQQVLRNPERNLLYDSLGYGEDSGAPPPSARRASAGRPRWRRHRPAPATRVIAWADCGDTPYQLRAYFAWKNGLPFRFRRCTRGTGTRGPLCPVERDNRTPRFDAFRHPVRRFNAFLREGIAWQVHSGTTRTLPEDETSDFYPIRLARDTIRPGTIFVDVGGHVLVVTQWDRDGLFAIDGHPDFSVTRRAFAEPYFRYFRGTRTGGFKAFRPLRLEGGRIVPVPNRGVAPFFSVEQYRFGAKREFYRAMGALIRDLRG